MRSGSVFWGIVLVVLGGLLLAQTTGMLPPGISIWSIFWSLVLVALGVTMLLRATGRARALEKQEAREPLQGARRATVSFHHGAGELVVDGSAAPDDLFCGAFAGGLDARVQRSGDSASADLRPPSDFFPFSSWPSSGGLDWTVGLNPDIPLTLNFEVGASRNRIDLRNLQVRELRLQTGASSTEVAFPERAGLTRAQVKSGVAAVDMRVPEGVAARIRASGGLASIDVDTRRFPRTGSEYVSPDYDTAENRLDLDIETGVGSVSVR